MLTPPTLTFYRGLQLWIIIRLGKLTDYAIISIALFWMGENRSVVTVIGSGWVQAVPQYGAVEDIRINRIGFLILSS